MSAVCVICLSCFIFILWLNFLPLHSWTRPLESNSSDRIWGVCTWFLFCVFYTPVWSKLSPSFVFLGYDSGRPHYCWWPPRWPSGKASASRAEDPWFESCLRRDFSGSSHTSDLKIGTPVATLPSTWHTGSALGLVGLVSVYCDWVRWKVWSATSISVWQHVKLSEQIRPWDTLACCWDVKQPTNKQPQYWWNSGVYDHIQV